MCGIGGFSGRFDAALLGRMNAAQSHRGPDDEGTWFDAGASVGLAHRRLAILDLSPAGHQPMWDRSGRVGIVFNGEIYGFAALRDELEGGGASFRSRSDTEVLIEGWLAWGEGLLDRIDGMFAFALWDGRDRRLLLARDHLGIKPLYLAETERGVLFASEIKALLQEPSLPREIDPEAIAAAVAFTWIPSPMTALRPVRALEPGCVVEVRDGRVTQRRRYWDLPYDRDPEPIAEADAVGRVRAAVEGAVQRQLVADVPVGAFLSGGVDSSSIVAIARRHKDRANLPCFSIGFRGGWAEGFDDDLPYARRVAEALDVDLHVIEVGPEMLDRLDASVVQHDGPHADPALLHVWSICGLARQNGVPVLLSGAGGDDLFTGYRRHHMLRADRVLGMLPKAARRAISRLSRRVPGRTASGRRVRRALGGAALEGDERIVDLFRWIDLAALREVTDGAVRDAVERGAGTEPLLRTLRALPDGVPPLHRMLYVEAKHFLADHNLGYHDRMSMAASIEVRVPLLDLAVVDVAARLPPSLKQRGHRGKWVFKRAMADVLPPEVLSRPKTGFGAPLRRWLHHELRDRAEDLLSERSLRARGLFSPVGVRALLDADRAGHVDAAYPLLLMMNTETWCRQVLDRGVSVTTP